MSIEPTKDTPRKLGGLLTINRRGRILQGVQPRRFFLSALTDHATFAVFLFDATFAITAEATPNIVGVDDSLVSKKGGLISLPSQRNWDA
jgi:hypothetical protein